MPTESIPIGMPVTLKANVIYALPGFKVALFSAGGLPFDISNSLAMTNFQSIALLNGTIPSIAGGFIRVAADTLVTIKRD